MTEEQMVTIPLKDWESAVEDQTWLRCLEDAGVDNWEGISFACQLLEEDKTNEENLND